MKIKLSTSRCGHTFDSNGRQTGEFTQAVGDVINLPDAEAQRLVDRGYAIAIDEPSRKSQNRR